jgi:Flp pilus assembly protein TadG
MIRRRLCSGRGQAAVELALVLPILLIVLYAIFEFGQVYMQYQEVSAATSEGARQAANMADVADPGRTSTVIATVRGGTSVSSSRTFDPAALRVTVSSTWTPGDPVTVTSKYAASVSILGVTLFSDDLTTRRTARVLD